MKFFNIIKRLLINYNYLYEKKNINLIKFLIPQIIFGSSIIEIAPFFIKHFLFFPNKMNAFNVPDILTYLT